MSNTDGVLFVVVELGLVLLTLTAIAHDGRRRVLSKEGAVMGTVKRGERSMGALFTVYGVGTVVWSLLVQAVPGSQFDVSLIVLNYICLTYLFCMNSWFRNRIFFPALKRARED